MVLGLTGFTDRCLGKAGILTVTSAGKGGSSCPIHQRSLKVGSVVCFIEGDAANQGSLREGGVSPLSLLMSQSSFKGTGSWVW